MQSRSARAVAKCTCSREARVRHRLYVTYVRTYEQNMYVRTTPVLLVASHSPRSSSPAASNLARCACSCRSHSLRLQLPILPVAPAVTVVTSHSPAVPGIRCACSCRSCSSRLTLPVLFLALFVSYHSPDLPRPARHACSCWSYSSRIILLLLPVLLVALTLLLFQHPVLLHEPTRFRQVGPDHCARFDS